MPGVAGRGPVFPAAGAAGDDYRFLRGAFPMNLRWPGRSLALGPGSSLAARPQAHSPLWAEFKSGDVRLPGLPL